uniref:Phosphofructokinase domain-containing protein n=1 Tax=Rhodosorus marinus TaxID=101924 RepID=A0A7S2ZND7_9RHOD|mmetsp:Transcript_24516/g.96787  ORF Transcript_24516/g.96787 Transcript_24516/m.96787 type:complete len:500 (+) Transcript_24516:508-2007(+)
MEDERGSEDGSTMVESAEMKRTDTMELLKKLKVTVGKDAASIHDHPKIKTLISEEEVAMYSKTICSNPNAHFNEPSKLSDWCDVSVTRSPLAEDKKSASFISPNETILVDVISHTKHTTVSREFLRAGPRELIAMDPRHVKAAIVTCGGLCPGLNTVVREVFMALKNLYGVEQIYGIPYGYKGFYEPDLEIRLLTEEFVSDIHHEGGSVLGSSRGGHNTKMICDAIVDFEFNQVYIIGGDGTHRGAIKIYEELKSRKLKASIIGIPKTIDNDIALIDRSFGFDTAVEEAQRAIDSAKTEAISAFNGIGLVKLMGRHSGYIAMFSTLASRDVDVCLIPEVKFVLEGPNGLFAYLEKLLHQKGHAVIVVAEGAGEELLDQSQMTRDASGNVKSQDVGLWLKDQILNHFKTTKEDMTLKYIDPTYMIRTVAANASDNLYCGVLGQNAVHGAFAGLSGFTVGLINTYYVYIPMGEISVGRMKVDVHSRMWHRVISTTRQPQLY